MLICTLIFLLLSVKRKYRIIVFILPLFQTIICFINIKDVSRGNNIYAVNLAITFNTFKALMTGGYFY